MPATSGELSRSEDALVTQQGRALIRTLLAIAALIGGAEGVSYHYGTLQIWESFTLTPLVPVLVTIAAFIDNEIEWLETPWKRRRVQSEFNRSSLMMLGTMVAIFGVVLFTSGFSADLGRITIDVGAGTSIACIGFYMVKRFSW